MRGNNYENVLDITGAIEKRRNETDRLIVSEREVIFLRNEVKNSKKTIPADELANRIQKAQDEAWVLVGAINIKSGDLVIK